MLQKQFWKPADLAKHLQEIASQRYPTLNLDDVIKNNVYFITINFNRESITRNSSYTAVVDETAKWFRRLSKEAFGKHIERVTELQPLGYIFADFDGTRQSGGRGGYGLTTGFPHVHGVLLIMPDKGQEFRRVLLSDGFKKTTTIRDVEIKQFDPDQGSLTNLMSYCMKGYQALPPTLADREEAMTILPRLQPKSQKR
jgi:hypothetical protein